MFKQIVVAIDGSATSNRGLAVALAMADDQDANLLMLHVIDELAAVPPVDTGYVPASYIDSLVEGLRERGRQVLEQAERQARERDVNARSVLVDSHGLPVSQVILSQARKAHADLIVLGTHGRRGLRRVVLGSDAENVLRGAACPVLLVRAPEPARKSHKASGRPARKPSAKSRPSSRAPVPAGSD